MKREVNFAAEMCDTHASFLVIFMVYALPELPSQGAVDRELPPEARHDRFHKY